MRRYYPASSLLVSLMMISSIGIILFLNRDYWLGNEKVSQNHYSSYLSEKLAILEYDRLDKEQECNKQQKESIYFKLKNLHYGFHCEFHSIFIQPKPTKEKYILVDNVSNWLDLKTFAHNVHFISALEDLPESSEENPKIVKTTQEISGRLTQPFYGIVITDYPFNYTDKRIYGTIYSSYAGNDPNRRNLSYKKSIIQNIERDNSIWHYLPNSNNLLHDENN